MGLLINTEKDVLLVRGESKWNLSERVFSNGKTYKSIPLDFGRVLYDRDSSIVLALSVEVNKKVVNLIYMPTVDNQLAFIEDNISSKILNTVISLDKPLVSQFYSVPKSRKRIETVLYDLLTTGKFDKFAYHQIDTGEKIISRAIVFGEK